MFSGCQLWANIGLLTVHLREDGDGVHQGQSAEERNAVSLPSGCAQASKMTLYCR